MPVTRRSAPLLVFTALLMLADSATARDWQTDSTQSTLRFSATAQGESFDGRFAQFTPQIRFDPHDASGRFDVTIELASVDTQNEERDATLHEPEFFRLEQHPQARYVAEQFSALGDGRFRADGTLTINGIEQPVPLDFTFVVDGDRATLDGAAQLDRLAFAVGSGDWEDTDAIAQQVAVQTRLVLQAVQ